MLSIIYKMWAEAQILISYLHKLGEGQTMDFNEQGQDYLDYLLEQSSLKDKTGAIQ